MVHAVPPAVGHWLWDTQALLEIARDKNARAASAAKRPCPKCRGARMMHY